MTLATRSVDLVDVELYQRAPGRYTFYRSNGYLPVLLVSIDRAKLTLGLRVSYFFVYHAER